MPYSPSMVESGTRTEVSSLLGRRIVNVRIGLFSILFMGACAHTSVAAPTIEVQGHRGARTTYAENSIPSFLFAVESGADVIELDMAVSKDDVLVVIHDLELSQTLCQDSTGNAVDSVIKVRDLTMQELKKYDCTQRPDPGFPKQRSIPATPLPTLLEVIEAVQKKEKELGRTVRFNLEVKSVPGRPTHTPSPRKYAELLTAVVKKTNIADRSNVQSFDQRILHEMANLMPNLTRAILVHANLLDVVAVAKGAKAHIVSPHKYWILPEQIKALHKLGIRVIPWTANTTEDWAYLLSLGVDGIITDDPHQLIEWLKTQ